MKIRPARVLTLLLPALLASVTAAASAYNARPKLIVVIVIDQFRGDYLERYHEQFGQGGFRLLMERGAWFTDCHYDYPTTFTAPGHATLFTGTYPNGHGIFANEWWNPAKKKITTSVEDDATTLVGAPKPGTGASPRNLLGSTLGDELKLATGGKARVFSISLKDRSAVLPAGFSADAAYWIDRGSGVFITSTFYKSTLPAWVAAFNNAKRAEKYLNLDWKDASGKVLRSTRASGNFLSVVGSTPFANDYEFEFARELVNEEKLGSGPATDLLVIGLSAFDILGHEVGPDSPQLEAMTLAVDRQLAEFFGFLGRQVGLANIWIALSADHGVSPTVAMSESLRLPAPVLGTQTADRQKVSAAIAARLGSSRSDFVRHLEWPVVFLNEEAFAGTKAASEADAERIAGEALKDLGARAYFTKSQLAAGDVPNTETGRRFAHSYSPFGGWYLLAQMPPFMLPERTGTTHGSPYSYDTHVPLAFYGLPFRSGIYRTHAEPVDMAPTLASLLGINPPSNATGRVLTEGLVPQPLAAELGSR
jgi:predicted AlkP superfamily pyrophosphatase or phosphodiesterase